MTKPTEVNIAWWLCMSNTCTKRNDIGDERCKGCDAKLAKGATALSADINEIGQCEEIEEEWKPIWKLHEAKRVSLWEARAESTYGWDYNAPPPVEVITAIRGDHTMWQYMTTVNDEYCEFNKMFEFSLDDKGCAIRVPILGCPKCKSARKVGTLALRDNWEIIGHLEDYTTLGEEVWEYEVPYDVDEPDPVLYRTVAGFGDGDITYDNLCNDRAANGD
ncbi:hypothetical protein FPCIR_4214 [Fusarium pseudocircinatum]|uniref:RanBP2-type domain-containing protein n=1 Tax=Fusarium pseudocircinatum TaxID=56676 RepID=A0A8H5PG63_9HYPO|nr:hypothetical protein FPCIR_4214 [Fusarium pseudocircinatum]